MPRLTPIAEVLTLDADFPITAIKGTLSTIFKAYKGTNDNGDWILQNGEIKDEAGNKIGLSLKNIEIPLNWKGREILIEAHKGDKGWSGVYAADELTKDKKSTVRKVKVTKTAEVSLYQEDGKTAQEPPPAQQQAQAQKAAPAPPQAQSTTTAAAQAPADEAKLIREAKLAVLQIANLQILCITMVETYVAPTIKEKIGRDLTTDEKHAWAMNAMIQAERENLMWKMPKHAMKDATKGDTTTAAPQPKPEPAPAKKESAAAPRTAEPKQRPSNIPASAVWDSAAACYYDPETMDYLF